MGNLPFGRIDAVLVGHGYHTAESILMLTLLRRIYGPRLAFDFVSLVSESGKWKVECTAIENRNVLLVGVLQSFVTNAKTVKRLAVDFVRDLSSRQNRIVGILDSEPWGHWDHALLVGDNSNFSDLTAAPMEYGPNALHKIGHSVFSMDLPLHYLPFKGSYSIGQQSKDRGLIENTISSVLASSTLSFDRVRCEHLVKILSSSSIPDEQLRLWIDEGKNQEMEVIYAIKGAHELRPGIFRIVQPVPITPTRERLVEFFLESVGEKNVKVLIQAMPEEIRIFINWDTYVPDFGNELIKLEIPIKRNSEIGGFNGVTILSSWEDTAVEALLDLCNVAW